MRKLAFIALSLVASATMAQTALGPNVITINGDSTQMTSVTSSTLSNFANGTNAQALQNLASNAGNITVGYGAYSHQSADVKNGSYVANEARSYATAQQNLASNVGQVAIYGHSDQTATVDNSDVRNMAWDHTIAQQSMSTNVGNVVVGGTSTQTTNLWRAGVYNTAYSTGAKAIQNLSSNNSCSTFSCAN
jgi:hypothetical protein